MHAGALKSVALCALGALAGGAVTYLSLPAPGAGPGRAAPSSIDDRNAAPETRSARRPSVESTPVATSLDPARLDLDLPELADDELIRLAGGAPRAAMGEALAIEAYWTQLDAIERIAVVWTRQAPHDALAYVQASNALDPRAKSTVRLRVLSEWAAIDARAVLSYLLGRDGQELFHFDRAASTQLAREVATRRPYAVLAAVDALPVGRVRTVLRDAAIAILVERDLAFALRQVAVARPGLDRAQWAEAIASAYVRQDPEGALEWAARFDAELPGTLFEVTTLVRELHPDRIE